MRHRSRSAEGIPSPDRGRRKQVSFAVALTKRRFRLIEPEGSAQVHSSADPGQAFAIQR